MDGAGTVRHRCWPWLVPVFLIGAAPSLLAQQTADEYQVKAAYLLKMASYVEWPAGSPRAGEQFQICVAGTDPFGRRLEDAAKGQAVGGREIKIRRIRHSREIRGCQVLFISGSSGQSDLGELLGALGHAQVLTVSDVPRFVLRGGMIEFTTTQDGRIVFEIGLQPARDAGLQISADLLRAAVAVRRER